MRTFVVDKNNRCISELHILSEADGLRNDLLRVEDAPTDIGDRYRYINNNWVGDAIAIDTLNKNPSTGNKTILPSISFEEAMAEYNKITKK